jgi:hypothetical protein
LKDLINRFPAEMSWTDGKIHQSKHLQGDIDDLIKLLESFVSKVQAATDNSKHAKHIVDVEIKKLFKKLETLIIVTDVQSRAEEIADWLIAPLHACMSAHLKNEGVKPTDLDWVHCSGLSPENKCSKLMFPFNLTFITQDNFTKDKVDPDTTFMFIHAPIVKETAKNTFDELSTGEKFVSVASQGLPAHGKTLADFNLTAAPKTFADRLYSEGGVYPGWDTNHPVRLSPLKECYSSTGRFRAFNTVWVKICNEASLQSAVKLLIPDGLFKKNDDGTFSLQVFTFGVLCFKFLTDPTDPTEQRSTLLSNNGRGIFNLLVGLEILPEIYLERIKPAYYTPGDIEKLFIDIHWEVKEWLGKQNDQTIKFDSLFSFLDSTKFTQSLESIPEDLIPGMTTLSRRSFIKMVFEWILVITAVENGGVPIYTKENTSFSGTITKGVDMFPIFDAVSGKATLGALFFFVDLASLTNSIYGGKPTQESFTPLAYEMFPDASPADMAVMINEFLIRCGNRCSDLAVRLNVAERHGVTEDECITRAEAASRFKVLLRRFDAIDCDHPSVEQATPMPGDESNPGDPTRVSPTPTPGDGIDPPPDDPQGLAHPKQGNGLENPGGSEPTHPNSASAVTPSHAGEGDHE